MYHTDYYTNNIGKDAVHELKAGNQPYIFNYESILKGLTKFSQFVSDMFIIRHFSNTEAHYTQINAFLFCLCACSQLSKNKIGLTIMIFVIATHLDTS